MKYNLACKKHIAANQGELMNLDKAKEIVMSVVTEVLEEAESEDEIQVTETMELIGGESLLDSMGLVSVCLALEDLADEHGFEFDWTSDAAMSKSRSMFRSIGALAEEFANQSEA